MSRLVGWFITSIGILKLLSFSFALIWPFSLQPHNFRRTKAALAVSRCDACQAFIVATGLTRGLVRCTECGFTCHEKCAVRVPRECPGVVVPHRRGQPHAGSVPHNTTTTSNGLPGTGTVRPWNRRPPSGTYSSYSPSNTPPMKELSPGLQSSGQHSPEYVTKHPGYLFIQRTVIILLGLVTT